MHESFYTNLAFGAVAGVAFFWAFTAPKAAQPVVATGRKKFLQMDVPGVVLLCGIVFCFTLAIRWAGASMHGEVQR